MTNWQSGQLNGCLTNKLLIAIYQLLLVPTLAIYQVYHLLYEKPIVWPIDQLINNFTKWLMDSLNGELTMPAIDRPLNLSTAQVTPW